MSKKTVLQLAVTVSLLALMPATAAAGPMSSSTASTSVSTISSQRVLSARGKCWGRVSKPITVGGEVWAPATRNGGSVNCYLEVDQINHNYAVRALQYSLKYGERISYVSIDGYYGPSVRRAISRTQNIYGLAADGVYGPATGSRMLRHHNFYGNGRWK